MGCGASAGGKYQKDIELKDEEIQSLQKQIKSLESVKHSPAHSGNGASQLPASVPAAKSEAVQEIQIKQGGARGKRHSCLLGTESAESKESRSRILDCLKMRLKYAGARPPAVEKQAVEGKGFCMVLVDGVAEIEGLNLPKIPSRSEFRSDLVELWKLMKSPELGSLAVARLERLEIVNKHYCLDHSKHETDAQVDLEPDLYSIMKVDNHIHLAAAMTPTMFLKFIKKKLEAEPDRVVAKGKTLRTIMQEACDHLPKPPGCDDLSKLDNASLGNLIHGDSLRMCAGDHFYQRFDNFNSAYSPLGSDVLRTVFMKTSNDIGGEYFGQLTQEIIHSYEKHHTYAELRLSIYGRKANEWDDLARWIKASDLHKPPWTERNMWIIQIPRVFKVFHKLGMIQNFEEFLNNIFQALFEVALEPSSHPDLADVLHCIVAFDCVDDESVSDPLLARRSQVYGDNHVNGSVEEALAPNKWNVSENPPYSYYSYFLVSNIRRFNDLCRTAGRPWNLTFRPHCGEAGEVHHLATSFLLADGINHGINLFHNPVLQYLYYLTQIGVSVAPMSNNSLFLKIKDNPFPFFLRRGLNVALSTDDPLMFHATNQPLLEEFTAARLIFGLSSTDLCEIAANSVRQSGFPLEVQAQALGDGAYKPNSPYEWDPSKCNVPERRLRFRRQNLAGELSFLQSGPAPPPMITEPDEDPCWATAVESM